MFCKNCGNENGEGVNFCQKCGTAISPQKAEEPVSQDDSLISAYQEKYTQEEVSSDNEAVASVPQAVSQENVSQDESLQEFQSAPKSNLTMAELEGSDEKPKNIKGLLIKFGIPVVALLVIVVICVNLFTPSKFSFFENTIFSVYNSDKEKSSVVVNNKLVDGQFDGDISYFVSSMKSECQAILSENNQLFFVNSKGVFKVSDDVSDMKISYDGKYISYIDSDDTLYLYNVGKKSKEKIADEVNDEYAISPDGKTVLYSVENDDGDDELFVSVNGKSTKLVKDLLPIGVSNGGKYIYAYSDSDLYTVTMKGDKNKISSDRRGGYGFNRDNTEILFFTKSGTDVNAYLSVKGDDKIKMSSSDLKMLLPQNHASTRTDFDMMDYDGMNGEAYDISSFKNQAFVGVTDVILVDKKGENEKIVKNVVSPVLTNDGKYVYYIKAQNLYRSLMKKDAESEKLASDVKSFAVTNDGKAAYFIDKDDTLRFVKGGGKSEKSEKILDDASTMVMTSKNVILCIDKDNNLYSSKNGSSKNKVTSDAQFVMASRNYAYYGVQKDDKASIYVSNGGTSFKVVVDKFPA